MKTNIEVSKHTGITTQTINAKGEHLVLSDDFPLQEIFIPFTLPNESIEFEKLKYKRASYYVFKNLISSENENRTNPLCKHFTVCGGCVFQHMNKKSYYAFKADKLKKHINQKYHDYIEEIIVIPNGLRRKANFEAIKKESGIYMGFHRFNSRQIINLETCKILREEIVEQIPHLKNLLENILENFQKAEFFIVLTENGLDIGLEIQKIKILSEEQKNYIISFCIQNNVTRFIFRHGNKYETIFQKSNEKNPFIKFDIFEININPWSFMQTSVEAEREMIKSMQFIINKIDKKDKMLDLFCGRGTYSLSLIQNFKKITAIELSDDSINELSDVAQKHNLDITTMKQDLFLNPIKDTNLSDFDVVIINPPRAGAESQSEELSKSNAQNIIYVSCNPETFARDLDILEKKYTLRTIQPIDQFIWLNHLEIIAWLTLKA
jgi:23S rRNA (uracil1939-C5)-methyltransferase